jgi:hypothetical protein
MRVLLPDYRPASMSSMLGTLEAVEATEQIGKYLPATVPSRESQ